MFIRKLKHHSWIKFAGFMLKLSPGVSYMLFAGQGSSRQLCLHMARGDAKRVLVVTDKPLVELGVVAQATSGLHEAGLEVVVFDGVLPDPTYEVVAEGKAIYEREACDSILAIGGGSSIDAAKVIGLALSHEGEPRDYVGFGKVKNPLPPFYTIPTTSGTGSEATMGAVISDNVSHEKGILSGATMLPVAACLDADLLTGLPPHITAATGMDALTHAIEAYIGVWERGDCMKTSATAVKLIFQHLPGAYSNGSDVNVRAEMAYAAYLAGQAINMVNVGNVHAIAHQLGAFYGVPHGLANAQVMPHVLDLSLEAAREPLTELAQVIGRNTAEEFVSAVRELSQAVGIPAAVEKLKVEDFPAITERAIAEADGYPVPYMLSKGDVQSILEKLSQ